MKTGRDGDVARRKLHLGPRSWEKQEGPSPGASRWREALLTPGFGTSGSRAVREYISDVLSHQACTNLSGCPGRITPACYPPPRLSVLTGQGAGGGHALRWLCPASLSCRSSAQKARPPYASGAIQAACAHGGLTWPGLVSERALLWRPHFLEPRLGRLWP